MADSGVDVNTFKPHSIRAVAASKAKDVFVPVKDTAGWSSERTFDSFHNKPFERNSGFTTSVLHID